MKVTQKWEEVRTLIYGRCPIGGWQWDKNIGFRCRVIQVISVLLRVNSIAFCKHTPIANAIREGFKEMQVVIEFIKPVEEAV